MATHNHTSDKTGDTTRIASVEQRVETTVYPFPSMWIINTDKTSLPRLICWYKGKPYNLRTAIVNNRLANKIFVTVDTSRCANYACMKALRQTINWCMFMSITKDHQLTKEQT